MIRIAKEEDLPDIVTIYNETIPGRMVTADLHEVSIENRVDWFNQHNTKRPLWVYEKENEVAGWLGFQKFHERCAYDATVEISIYIKSKFQRQGIAKQLISYALEQCPKLEISTILGLVFGHNDPSIKLLLSFDFEKWGELPKIANLDGFEADVIIYGLRT